jgi:hypothetical protein
MAQILSSFLQWLLGAVLVDSERSLNFGDVFYA